MQYEVPIKLSSELIKRLQALILIHHGIEVPFKQAREYAVELVEFIIAITEEHTLPVIEF